jgi:hypothetical protein
VSAFTVGEEEKKEPGSSPNKTLQKGFDRSLSEHDLSDGGQPDEDDRPGKCRWTRFRFCSPNSSLMSEDKSEVIAGSRIFMSRLFGAFC